MADERFHPAGPVTYPVLQPGACPRCKGDVEAVLVAGLLAYFQCRACKAAFKAVPAKS